MSFRFVSLVLFSALASSAHAYIDIDVGSGCRYGHSSTDVTVRVNGERFRFNPSCGFSFSDRFKLSNGAACRIESGMCSNFSPSKRVDVRCAGHGSNSERVACKDSRLAVMPKFECARLERIYGKGLPKTLTICSAKGALTLLDAGHALVKDVPFKRFSTGSCNDGGCGAGAWFYETDAVRMMIQPIEQGFYNDEPLDTCSRAGTVTITMGQADGTYSFEEEFPCRAK